MKPRHLVADRSYDSRRWWERLHRLGIELIAPHLRTPKHRWQDGRRLRRYRRRY